MGDAGGVGEGTDDVEDRANPQLVARDGRVSHGGVVRRREEKRDARLAKDRRVTIGRQVDGDAQHLEHVGGYLLGWRRRDCRAWPR